MNVDAGRFSPATHHDIEPQGDSATPKPAPSYRDEHGFSVAPKPDQSALPFLARSQNAAKPREDINSQEVDFAVRNCRGDIPMRESQLANALRNPNLNQSERNLVIQKLAREGGELAFYANDASRVPDADHAALSEDQRVIADGVQKAYSSGAIDTKDLQRIADKNGAPNGAQRFMSIMRLGASAKEDGSATQTLADALWTRNGADGKDRAAAATYFTSDPALMASKLNTPDKRAAAFESIVNFNQSEPYKNLPPGATTTNWQNDTTTAAGRLFVSHGQELMDRYTNVTPKRGAQTEVLSKFMSQTVLNPEAKGVVLDRQRDLVPTIQSVLGSGTDTYLNRAKEAGPDSPEQIGAMEQLGRLSASVSGGASLALTKYSGKVAENEEQAQAMADLVGSTVGAMTGRLDTPFGNPAEASASAITKEIVKATQDHPERPRAAISGELYDQLSSRIAGLETELKQPKLSTYFDATRGAEGHTNNENLNVNPGGHAN